VAELKPAYLISGDDDAKIAAALQRLRQRAEREGGPGALESFSPVEGDGPPDLDGLLGAIPALSLVASRRYLLADRLERLNAKQVGALTDAVGNLPSELTLVLIERTFADRRDKPSKAKADARKALLAAVEAAGGEILGYESPKTRDLPRYLVAEANGRGFALDRDAAELLVARMGGRTARLANELDRLSLWAGQGGTVSRGDLESMVADTSEEVAWALSDAVVDRDAGAAVMAAERLRAQGETVTGLVWQVAKRLRAANLALTALAAGRPQAEVERGMGMHPYAAKMLIRRLRGGSADAVRSAACAVADLEWWTRGGSDYPDDVALTLAVRRAAGGEG
jgi:DNA polymerase III delta subunit